MSREKGFTPERFGREELPEEKKVEQRKQEIKKTAEQIRAAKQRGDLQEVKRLKTETKGGVKKERQEAAEALEAKLYDVEDLKPNIRLKAIDKYHDLLANCEVTRKAFRTSQDPKEKQAARRQFTQAKKELDSFFDNPEENKSFEKAYLEWTKSKKNYAKFLGLETKSTNIKKELAKPAFSGDTKEFSEGEIARLERMSKRQQQDVDLTVDEEKDALEYLFTETDLKDPAKKKEYLQLLLEIQSPRRETKATAKKSKAELLDKAAKIERELDEMWQDPMIRRHEGERQLNKLFKDLAAGQDVLEMPSTIHGLNRLQEWENLHQRTTIGGVLVGEPGTGKTTLIHHYLEGHKRNYVYLDLSEEVTRYMLFGTKALEFKSSTEYFGELSKQISEMDEKQFRQFIKNNAKKVADAYHLSSQESEAAFFKILQEELANASKEKDPSLQEELSKAKETMLGTVGQKYNEELAGKFKHLVQKNGWRDGVIIAALRRGDSVILDEFVKSRDLTLLYGLTTAKPGEKWYFEDNDEYIDVADHWRMYFTANIGRRHGAYRVAEALASRAQGKVMEVNYPPTAEELTVALAETCDSEGNFLINKEEIAKIAILVKDIFPKIRTLLKSKEGSIPISWRTIRDIGEKLVTTKKDKNGLTLRQRTNKNIDQAIYEVLIESYSLYEDKSVPREVVNIATSTGGLFLIDSLKREIVDTKQWLTEDEFEKRKELFKNPQETIDEIVKILKGERSAVFTSQRPERIAA